MTCERVNALLTLYVDEGLPARDAGRVAGHLARCADCRAELQALEQTLAVLDRVRPQVPPIDLWEQFRNRLEAERAGARVAPASSGTAAPAMARVRNERRARLLAWSIPCGRGWCRPLAVPAIALAAGLVALAGFAIGIGSSGSHRVMAINATMTRAPAVPWQGDRTTRAAPKHPARQQAGPAVPATPGPAGLTRRPLRVQISPPEARMAVSPDAPRLAGSGGRVSPPVPERVRARAVAYEQPTRRIASSSGQYPVAVPPPAQVAEALQSSVEETTRQRVVEEVALLAQELNQAEAHTSDFFGPSGPREPS